MHTYTTLHNVGTLQVTPNIFCTNMLSGFQILWDKIDFTSKKIKLNPSFFFKKTIINKFYVRVGTRARWVAVTTYITYLSSEKLI